MRWSIKPLSSKSLVYRSVWVRTLAFARTIVPITTPTKKAPNRVMLRGTAILSLLFVGLLSLSAVAGIDTHEFNNDGDRDRYNHFIDELRCPKCKNQNLAGSAAPIAQDLRRELHRLITEGESNKGIVDFMVDRYGDFVLYRPPLQKNTYALWFGTGGMLLLGVIILLIVIFRRSTAISQSDLTDGEQEQLESFLEKTKAQDAPQAKTKNTKKKK